MGTPVDITLTDNIPVAHVFKPVLTDGQGYAKWESAEHATRSDIRGALSIRKTRDVKKGLKKIPMIVQLPVYRTDISGLVTLLGFNQAKVELTMVEESTTAEAVNLRAVLDAALAEAGLLEKYHEDGEVYV